MIISELDGGFMKEYIVIGIKCNDNITLKDTFSIISSIISYDRNLFAIQNLNSSRLNQNAQSIYGRLDLKRFEYRVVLNHLLNTDYYDPEQHDIQMISNLDKCWKWHNEHTNESLSQDDFHDLMSFIDTLKAHDFASLVVGFDNIKWGEEQVNNGTYGYEKADGAYGLGRNYLSNSLIIGKTAENKSYTAYVSLEKRFRDFDIINQITESLGKIISEEVYFAPENKEERDEWNLKANEAKQKFDNAISGLQTLKLISPHNMYSWDPKKKININGYIKNHLCVDGWQKRPARSYESPTIICKNKHDREIAFSIVSGRNGQNLQALIQYSGKEFLISENLHNLFVFSSNEEDTEIFFKNLVLVRDYLFDTL